MTPTSGSQVVAKSAALLRALGTQPASGVSTTDLARATSMSRPTAHRILAALMVEGLVDRDTRTGAWLLGPELYLLGAGAARRYDVKSLARDVVEQLARDSGESAFLSARRGDETVCVHGEEGSFPLRSHVLHPGVRFPLGVASAGLAILSHLPEREVEDYLHRVDLTEKWGPLHAENRLRERIVSTRETGYAVNPGLLVTGSWGMGAAVFDVDSRPAFALSLTGVQTRFRRARREQLGSLLLDAAHVLSKRLAGRRG